MAITSATATTAMMAHDRRTVGSMIDDQTIELRAQSKVSQIPEVRDYAHISVTSYNNIVLLTGQVPYDYVKDQISDSVNGVPGVRRVFNELTVAESNSLLQRSKDSWITTKVKTALLAQGHIDPTRIKVITENDVVYLLGLVNFQEAEIASEIAQTTSGVKEVIRAFEYM
jgi:osmotically-inducible protein OsmY